MMSLPFRSEMETQMTIKELPPRTSVTISALLNLIRLLACELVARGRRDDVERLVQALNERIDDTPLPITTDIDAARSGRADARLLLVPVIERIKAQAKKCNQSAKNVEVPANRSTMLN
jgi:hypothetical protein